jgi:hypothetical protein
MGTGSNGVGDWDYGFYKGECGNTEIVTGLVAGVSRHPQSGAVHAILCCD